ncbi:amidohydrolase [Marinibactrum halimedae]|uniref:5-methylthioadenosine/S-adenosylhomocysteine deaminase n=1 Tax=Marinibactrum halimedae TaxID=1444977 RepID=A0AA37WP60_9GAMM|nr:amidohydrolase [Marinibactrum halimedae]MCD9459676.1 amidohydrolase [Marinibactrum halimedae]GLS25702.1 hypothetical protein GCM10007877_14160 [Marinibactrum halimedae]
MSFPLNRLLSAASALAALTLSGCATLDTQNSANLEPVELIATADYVVTMDDNNTIIQDGAIAVRDGKIIAISDRNTIESTYHAQTTLNGEKNILLPGLVNGHTHTAMTLFRGMADDLELMTWLNNYIFPMEGQFVSPEFVSIGTELACYEMIRGGTTTFVDMYFYPEVIAEVTDQCGLRAIIAAPMIDFPSPGFTGWDDSFAAGQTFVRQWQGKHPRITPALAPHAPYTVSKEHLKAVGDIAAKLNAPISIHLAETQAEHGIIQERYQNTPVAHTLAQFDEKTTVIAAHMVHPTDSDIDLLSQSMAGPIHNPTSNLKLGSGFSPVMAMQNKGIAVGLGTDGAASNNDLDMWEEIRLAALIHKGASQNPTAVPARSALAMATRDGAKAVKIEHIGQISEGFSADFVLVDYDDTRLAPVYDVISHLVYAIDSTDVDTTVVAGKVLMENKEVLTIDELALKAKVESIANKIKAALAKSEK